MAINDGGYWQGWANSSASGSYVLTTSGSSMSYTMPANYHYSGSTNPPPREPTPLEWLDAETEKVCKLARMT